MRGKELTGMYISPTLREPRESASDVDGICKDVQRGTGRPFALSKAYNGEQGGDEQLCRLQRVEA